MKNNDSRKSTLYQLPSKNYSAIQNYLRRIHQIKNDTQFDSTSKQSHHYSHSNFLMSSTQMNQTQKNQNHFQKSRSDNHQKMRCFSMKSAIPPEIPITSNQVKQNTFYNRKFNLTNIKIKQDLLEKSNKKNKTTVKNIHRKALSTTNNFLSKQRVATQPNQTFFTNFESKQRLNTTQSQNQIPKQIIIEAKDKILQKIRSYVQQLDQKGEDQLNQMLTNQYRKRIRFHSDAYRYESRIKQMIDTNKQIVKLLKQQLLTQRNLLTSPSKKTVNPSQKSIVPQSITPDKMIIIDKLELNLQNKHQQKEHNQVRQEFLTQTIFHNENTESQKPEIQNEEVQAFNYENQLTHVTKQFASEWSKSQTHKKAIYQKFRSTIFQQFPEIRKRQRKIKGLPKDKFDRQSSSQDDDPMAGSLIGLNFQSQLDSKKQIGFKATMLESKKTSVKMPQQSPLKKMHTQLSLSNSHACEIGQSFQKKLKLSKKNSLSKGSTRTLDFLSSQDKVEVAKINFGNLIEFIFKRAFFYSVSKKKIIENKAPYGQMRYTPRVEKKDSSISFILYNGSSNEKRHLKVDKLNQKKLRATGNYLIKNKFKIMSLQKEGNKSFDFLRRCLDDAIEDYLKGAKTK